MSFTYHCDLQGGWFQGPQKCAYTPVYAGPCSQVSATVKASCNSQLMTDCFFQYAVAGQSRGQWRVPNGQTVTVQLPLTCYDLNKEHEIIAWGSWGEISWQFSADVSITVYTPTGIPETQPVARPAGLSPAVLAGIALAGAGIIAGIFLWGRRR